MAQVNELNLNVLNNKFIYLNIDMSMLTGKVNAMKMQYIHVLQGLGTKDMIYIVQTLIWKENVDIRSIESIPNVQRREKEFDDIE